MGSVFGVERKDAIEETSLYMGASIENNHLLASLLERIKDIGKCDIIQ